MFYSSSILKMKFFTLTTLIMDKTEMMGNFLKMLLKTSGQDVPVPQPLLEKKERELLKSPKARDIWVTVQIDTAGLSKEEIRGISAMLLFKNFTTTELLDVDNSNNPKLFVTEILDFLKEHSEYIKSRDEIDSQEIIDDFFGD